MQVLEGNRQTVKSTRPEYRQQDSIMDNVRLSVISNDRETDGIDQVHKGGIERNRTIHDDCAPRYCNSKMALALFVFAFSIGIFALMLYREGYFEPIMNKLKTSNKTQHWDLLKIYFPQTNNTLYDSNNTRTLDVEEVTSYNKIKYPPVELMIVFLVVSISISVFVMMSSTARCIALLTLPGLSTSRGKAILWTVILKLLFSGPLANTLDNAKKIPEATSCQVEMLTKEVKAVQYAMFIRVQEYSEEFETTTNRLFGFHIEAMKSFSSILFKLANSLKAFAKFNPDPQLGTIRNVSIFWSDVNNYTNDINAVRFLDPPQVEGIEKLSDVGEKLNADFDEKTAFLQKIIGGLGILAYVSIVVVLGQACCYYRGYNRHLHYRNIYVTKSFKKKDSKRKAMSKETLLPLKRKERSDLIDTSCCISQQEIYGMLREIIIFTPFAVAAAFLCLIDYVLFRILEIIQAEANVTMVIDGANGFHIELNDTSQNIRQLFYQEVPNLFASNTTTFNYTLEIKTEACLPDPLPPFYRDSQMTWLISWFIVTFILTIFSSYGARLQHTIAAWYNPDRENERIHYLYHHLMTQRKTFLQLLRGKVRSGASSAGDEFYFRMWLAAKSPCLKRIMQAFHVLKEHVCVNCESGKNVKLVCGDWCCQACIDEFKASRVAC
ncbi:unnamed protein product [Owenia fusiformis]|uniref:Uncharacterized protein n=1 Tax=Owenia fusiformis TaxID=6347 RepID=A0A8J1TXM7_OWEFU|nr:unnamed protein product [Owenia fusiformis]